MRSVVTWTTAIGAVWFLVAVLRPETTLHLGPVFLPLLPVLLLWGQSNITRGVIAGVSIGAVTILLLTVTGNLEGPPIEPFTDPLTESVVVLAGAATVALIIARIAEHS